MKREIRKTMVVICEGSVTEPNYFHGLAGKINKAEGRPRIIIRPKPPLLDDEEKAEAKAELERATAAGEIEQSGRRRRVVKVVEDEPEAPIIPEGFIAQPMNYVWQAQQELEIHDEAWAVFDLDGHPKHEQAFMNAHHVIRNKTIDIAFSSISFETWILLHFEYCITAFAKSQCRTKDALHDCGQGVHIADCNGKNCTTGYMKIKEYIAKADDVKKTSFDSLQEKTFEAITNSLMLREKHANPIDCHKFNPITTVDRLVFKLLYIDSDYKWIRKEDLPKHHITCTLDEAAHLNIVFFNNTETGILLNPSIYRLCNLENQKIEVFTRQYVAPGESVSEDLYLNAFADFNPKYLVVDNEDSTSDIIEIQCL